MTESKIENAHLSLLDDMDHEVKLADRCRTELGIEECIADLLRIDRYLSQHIPNYGNTPVAERSPHVAIIHLRRLQAVHSLALEGISHLVLEKTKSLQEKNRLETMIKDIDALAEDGQNYGPDLAFSRLADIRQKITEWNAERREKKNGKQKVPQP